MSRILTIVCVLALAASPSSATPLTMDFGIHNTGPVHGVGEGGVMLTASRQVATPDGPAFERMRWFKHHRFSNVLGRYPQTFSLTRDVADQELNGWESTGVDWDRLERAIREMSQGIGNWSITVGVAYTAPVQNSDDLELAFAYSGNNFPLDIRSLPLDSETRVTDVDRVQITVHSYESWPTNWSVNYQFEIIANVAPVPEPASFLAAVVGGAGLLTLPRCSRAYAAS
mgnify:CR=1 FL=1